jgi:hypothetical protein
MSLLKYYDSGTSSWQALALGGSLQYYAVTSTQWYIVGASYS